MSKTILVADDNLTIRKRLCQIFASEENFDVCAEAANGQEAVDLATKRHPDLIILDLSMPVMNGLSAAREIKKVMPDVPIILFTQCADLGRFLLASDLPVDRVIAKTEIQGLIEHVRALVPL